jgi:hypothetical protein
MAYTRHMDVDDHNDNDDGDDRDSDLLAIGAAIRAALDKGVDPYAVAGIAAAGAAFAIAQHIPPDKRERAADALVLMLREQLRTHGV